MKKNIKNLLLYIGIPIVLITAMFLVSQIGTSRQGKKYYEIVDLIKSNGVSEYSLNLYSGELKYVLRADGKTYTYSVASPSLFVEDMSDFI